MNSTDLTLILFLRDLFNPSTSRLSIKFATVEDSLLGRLPAELRNTIYELVLVSAKPINVMVRDQYLHYFQQPVPNPPPASPTALIQTCKTIAAESRLIFYSSNTFRLHAAPTPAPLHQFFFGAFPKHLLLMLRDVQLCAGTCDSFTRGT